MLDKKGGGRMNITKQIRQLERAGFSGETLDRAIALAGGSRLIYLALCGAVEQRSMTPASALAAVECAQAARHGGET